MASTEEVLKALQNANIATLAATEPEELVIDAESRTITVPSSERLFGVTGDMNIERKYFRCPKIVGDNVDLSTHQIFIAYVYTETESGSIFPSIGVAPYHCEDVEVDGEDITFSWKLTGNVFKNPGFILFKMYAKRTEADPNTVFNTTPAIGTVLATIPDGTEEIKEEYPDVIAQIFDRLDALESGGGTGGTTNYENLSNKPQLNGVTLEGNKTLDQVGVLAKNQGSNNSGKFLSVGSDGNVVPADAPSGGTVDPEQIEQAVNGYLEENPVSGMTAEQEQQLNQNTTDVADLKSASYSEKVKNETFVDHAVPIEIDPNYERVNMDNLKFVSASESTDGIKTSGLPYENDDFNKKLTKIITLPQNEIVALWTTGSETSADIVDFTDFYKDGSAPVAKYKQYMQQWGDKKYVYIVQTRETEPMKIRLSIACSVSNIIYIDMVFRGVSDGGNTIANNNIPDIVKTVVPFHDMFTNNHVSVIGDAKGKHNYKSSKLLYVPAYSKIYALIINGYLPNGKAFSITEHTESNNEVWDWLEDHDTSWRWWKFNRDVYVFKQNDTQEDWTTQSVVTISYDQYLSKKYSEYEYQMNDKYVELLSGKLQSDNFRGRNCYVIADSLTDYTDWHTKMCAEMGMTLVDKAVAGKKMVTSGLTDTQSIPTSDEDAVIIYWLGVNDDLPGEGVDNTSTDQTNLYGAYNAVCDYLTENFPNATVLFILMHNSALKGESQVKKNTELEKIMTTKGFECWNPYNEIEANYTDGYKDGLHIGGAMADRVRQKVKMILKTM